MNQWLLVAYRTGLHSRVQSFILLGWHKLIGAKDDAIWMLLRLLTGLRPLF